MLEINECERNPCKNNGNCTNLVNDYQCQCEKGFKGKDCEKGIIHYKNSERLENLKICICQPD